MHIRGRKVIGKARRSQAFRRRHDPSLTGLLPDGRILSDGTVELTQIDGSTIVYQVAPVVGWRVTSVIPPRPVLARIADAVRASVAEALAVGGLPADSRVDITSAIYTTRQALGRRTNNLAVQRMARAAGYLAVERYLDIVTTPVAAE
jgi:hypothetical protein